VRESLRQMSLRSNRAPSELGSGCTADRTAVHTVTWTTLPARKSPP
jgi:hypothetical protein